MEQNEALFYGPNLGSYAAKLVVIMKETYDNVVSYITNIENSPISNATWIPSRRLQQN